MAERAPMDVFRLGCACLILSRYPRVTWSLERPLESAPRRQSCGNAPPVRCEEKLNCFEPCGASSRKFISVAAAAYSAWEAKIIDMVRPGDDST